MTFQEWLAQGGANSLGAFLGSLATNPSAATEAPTTPAASTNQSYAQQMAATTGKVPSFADLVFGAGTSGSTPPYTPGFGPNPPEGYVPPPVTPPTTPPITPPVTPPTTPPGTQPTTPPWTPWIPPAMGSGNLQPVSQMNGSQYLQMLQPVMKPGTSRGVPTSNIYGAQLNAKNPSGYQTYLNIFDSILNAPKQMPNYQFTPAPTTAQTAANSAAGGVQPGSPPSQPDTGSYGQWVYG